MIGLDKYDNAILDLLSKESLHPSKMAKELRINRTTLSYRLQRLRRLRLIESSIIGRKNVYRLIFERNGAKKHIQTFSGRDITNAYKEFLNLPKKSIILSVQGSGAVAGELNNLPHGFIAEAHRIFKKKCIMIKGFSNEKAFRVFDRLEKPLIQSHIGRSLGLKIFNNSLFTCKGEVMITSKLLLLANPVDKKVILIKDKEIVRVVHDTLELLFELLENTSAFDLNSHLKKTYF